MHTLPIHTSNTSLPPDHSLRGVLGVYPSENVSYNPDTGEVFISQDLEYGDNEMSLIFIIVPQEGSTNLYSLAVSTSKRSDVQQDDSLLARLSFGSQNFICIPKGQLIDRMQSVYGEYLSLIQVVHSKVQDFMGLGERLFPETQRINVIHTCSHDGEQWFGGFAEADWGDAFPGGVMLIEEEERDFFAKAKLTVPLGEETWVIFFDLQRHSRTIGKYYVGITGFAESDHPDAKIYEISKSGLGGHVQEVVHQMIDLAQRLIREDS